MPANFRSRWICAAVYDFNYLGIASWKNEIGDRNGGRVMPLSAGISFFIILLVALATFGTRVIPFLVFPRGKEIPPVIQYLGKVLTPAVIGMLVVYCLKETPVLSGSHGLPELIAVVVTAGLHVWKRNNLLSIGVGTVLYMVLVQTVF